MLIRFKWKDCDLCDGDALWLEATEQEAKEQVFPLLDNEDMATSEHCATASKALAELMGRPECTFCFLVAADLTSVHPFKAAYPVHQLWNGYSPFEEMDPIEVIQLSEIKNIRQH